MYNTSNCHTFQAIIGVQGVCMHSACNVCCYPNINGTITCKVFNLYTNGQLLEHSQALHVCSTTFHEKRFYTRGTLTSIKIP